MGNQHTRYKDLSTDETRARYRKRWAGVRDHEWDYVVNLVKETNTCLRGHIRNKENLYVSPGGKKHCRPCKALRDKGMVKQKYPNYSRIKKREEAGLRAPSTSAQVRAVPEAPKKEIPKWRPSGWSAEPRIPVDYSQSQHSQSHDHNYFEESRWPSSGGAATPVETEQVVPFTQSGAWKGEQDFAETEIPMVSDTHPSMTTTSG